MMNRAAISRSISRRLSRYRHTIARNSMIQSAYNELRDDKEPLIGFLEKTYKEKLIKKHMMQSSTIPNVSFASEDSTIIGLININSPKLNDNKISSLAEESIVDDNGLRNTLKFDELITPRPQELVPVPQPKPLQFVKPSVKIIKGKENSNNFNASFSSKTKAAKPKAIKKTGGKKCKNCITLLSKGFSTYDCECRRKNIL